MRKLVKIYAGEHSYGLWRTEHYIGVRLINGKSSHFLGNIIGNKKTSTQKETRSRIAQKIKKLRKNDWKYYVDYCGKFKNPVDFLNWVSSNNMNFTHGSKAVAYNGMNVINLGGNLKECSAAFRIVFLDMDYFFREIKPLLPPNFIIEHISY